MRLLLAEEREGDLGQQQQQQQQQPWIKKKQVLASVCAWDGDGEWGNKKTSFFPLHNIAI